MITLEQARALYATGDPVHDFHHIQRVLNLAQRIAQEEGADTNIVTAAVLLHDLKRGDAGEEHGLAASQAVDTYLPDAPLAFREAVKHAIRSHRYSEGEAPHTLEAKVVFDADKLDSIGAIGIARAFGFAGVFGHPLYIEADPTATYTAAERNISAYHEYLYKLRHVADRLYTGSAKRIAKERHAFMVAFFERLSREVKGEA